MLSRRLLLRAGRHLNGEEAGLGRLSEWLEQLFGHFLVPANFHLLRDRVLMNQALERGDRLILRLLDGSQLFVEGFGAERTGHGEGVDVGD